MAESIEIRGLDSDPPSGDLSEDTASAPTRLTEPERMLWAAYPRGEWVDLGVRPPDGEDASESTVRAEVISGLLLGASEPHPGYVPAVRLRGARITGRLNIAGGVVDSALRLRDCVLERTPKFSNAQIRRIRMTGCRMPGFRAGGLRVDGYLDLSGSIIQGEVWLPRAQLSGGLRLDGARIVNPDGWALFAAALTVEGGMFARGSDIAGGFGLVAARIGGVSVHSR